ncbi:MAG: translation initiation factor IF-2 associated domain-containing protein, partial [Pseudomonadota bacterium]
MSENEGDSKTGPDKKKTLTLRGTGLSQGTVKQSFSHGRSKSVVVETRKRRITRPGDTPPAAPAAKKAATPEKPKPQEKAPAAE